MLKIGITERGDAGLDLSWEKKLESVAGAVLITKSLTPAFCEAVMRHKNKLVVHATCTGHGCTILEPNVPPYISQIRVANELVRSGFPLDHLFVRIDPIIPTPKGIEAARAVFKETLEKTWIRRFRISVLDMYPHVRERFLNAGLPLPYGDRFSASDEQFAAVDRLLAHIRAVCDGNVRIVCCAEPHLHFADHVGCVSEEDLKILGLDPAEATAGGYQRNGCLCIGNKVELLENKHPCPHQCLYCYWRDPGKKENSV